MPRPLAACHEDLHKIFKDLDQDLHARTPKRISRVHHKRTTRSSEKPPRTAFIQAPLRHITRAVLCRNLKEKCRAPGPGQPFFASLRSRNTHGHLTKAIFMRECTGKMRRPKIKENLRRRLCASLRSRNAIGHFTRALLCRNLQVKGRRPAGAP